MQISFGQVVVTRDNTNLSASSSVGLDIRSNNQAVAFPENNISSLTDLTAYKGAEPKGGSIIFSNNATKDSSGNVISESLYGYFYWDIDSHSWVKLLDSSSFTTEYDNSLPMFFSNFDKENNTSTGVELSADSSWPVTNTAGANLSSMIPENHVLNSDLTNYWTVLDSNFQPTFNFSKGTKALFKVNAMLTKAGSGAYDFAVAMGVFLNDKLVATRVYPFSNTTANSQCSRTKMTLLASVDNLVANTSYKVKIGFRIIGNNYYDRGTTTESTNQINSLNGSKIFVGKAVTTTNPVGSGCSGVSAFESPVNLTIFGVSK